MATKQSKSFTVGQSVTWKRKNGLPAKGTVLRVCDVTSSGPWIDVTVVGQTAPARVRPAVLKGK